MGLHEATTSWRDIPTIKQRLDAMVEELSELMEDAEGAGWMAVYDKAAEAIGPLTSAADAARQYESGELSED